MDFLGVGPLELIFILILALIIFGPNDIVRAGKTLGSFMRKVVTSDGWKAFQQARKGMSDIPTQLMREAGLEEDELRQMSGMDDIQNATQDLQNQISPWTTPPIKLPDNPANPVGEPTPADGSQPRAEPEEPPTPPPGSPFSQTIDDNNS
jgi:Sec-independent protein translocase protein TatA